MGSNPAHALEVNLVLNIFLTHVWQEQIQSRLRMFASRKGIGSCVLIRTRSRQKKDEYIGGIAQLVSPDSLKLMPSNRPPTKICFKSYLNQILINFFDLKSSPDLIEIVG